MQQFDIVVAGGGVNALACATVLARAGLSVCVVERNPWVGGGAVTREVTLPGFKHDLYGSSHVWIHCNPDFREIKKELENYGLTYIWSENQITGHPDRSGGPGIVIDRSIDKTVESITRYSERDAARYRRVHDDFSLIRDGFLKAFFSPPAPPSLMAQAMERSREGLKRLREFSLSALTWVEQNFENDFVRAVMLNWAMATRDGAIPRSARGCRDHQRAGTFLHHREWRSTRPDPGRRTRGSRPACSRVGAGAQTNVPQAHGA